jgi:hypothetical protein
MPTPPVAGYVMLDDPDQQRFWSKVKITDIDGDGCWFWRGHQKSAFAFRQNNRVFQVSPIRIAWQITHGRLLSSEEIIRHSCDSTVCKDRNEHRTVCVNPAHLLVGTLGDVDRDRKRRGRTWVVVAGMPSHGRGRFGLDGHRVSVRKMASHLAISPNALQHLLRDK